jgi:K+-sensing histidine kinase KdpD
MTDSELGHLLSLISHELRGPLGVVRGYLRLLEQQRTALSDLQRQAIAGATRAGDRSAELLNHLSALARLYRGEAGVERKTVALEPLLRAALTEAHAPAEPVVTLHVGDVPPLSIAADEALMKTALAAFVTALARTRVTDSRVVISATDEARDGARGAAIKVAPGSPTTDSVEEQPLDLMRGGLGFDLPIAAYIMDAHHGHVAEQRAESRLVGFVVWLPLAAG